MADHRWPDGQPEQAALRCESCQALVPEHHKSAMLEHGRWVAQAEGDGVTAGYHLSALYSPLGWYAWGEMARDFLNAKHEGPEKLKTWINTCLGETWEESGEVINQDSLMARREHYPAVVPLPVLVLTAGGDVQDDRLELEVCGWRTGEESWGISYRVLWGDPAAAPVWRQLDDVLSATWEREDGLNMRIVQCCIDSAGHRTEAVSLREAASGARRVRHGWPGRRGPADHLGSVEPQAGAGAAAGEVVHGRGRRGQRHSLLAAQGGDAWAWVLPLP
ncbi:MAG: phage terminase large subunit family protein [bacterium]|nr:phage terminase large subunit family protein [bacterium]